METPPLDARSAFPPPTGLALASLVLGIAAVAMSFILAGFLIGLIGVALGVAYLNRNRGPTAMARWGVGLSLLGIFASIGFAVLYYHYYHLIRHGTPGGAGAAPAGALSNPSPPPASGPSPKSNLDWSATIPGPRTLCAGGWERSSAAPGSLKIVSSRTQYKITASRSCIFQILR